MSGGIPKTPSNGTQPQARVEPGRGAAVEPVFGDGDDDDDDDDKNK